MWITGDRQESLSTLEQQRSSSMTIYIPYFYIIEEISTRIYYAGSKWALDANPERFMIEDGYTTSSKIINSLIFKNGIESFKIRKIIVFTDSRSAYEYETKFLKRVNAKDNKRFYNKHNNDKITPGTKEFESIMLERYGVKNVMQDPYLYKKWVESFEEKYGVTNPYQIERVKQKAIDTRIKKYGVKYFNHKMIREIVKERYGVENVSQIEEVKEKKKNTTRKNYGVDNPFQSEEVKSKIESTNIERYGAENIMKTELGKKKVRDSIKEKYGVDNYSKTDEFKESNRKRLINHHSRPIVKLIRQYQLKYKLSFGRGWTNKSNEKLEEMLHGLIEEYGKEFMTQ